MKHEEPRTVPSSRGHSGDVSASASASATAALRSAKHKPQETRTTPKNNMSPSAARAASFAADQRSQSSHGQERSLSASAQTPSTSLGSSAAAHAYRAHSPQPEPQRIAKDRPSLLAAQGAAGAARPRSLSTPVLRRPVSDQASGDGNGPAHETATQRWESKPRPGSAGDGAALVTMPHRAIFTANPPTALQAEEKRKADELHDSAVAMAKEVFEKQPKLAESFLPKEDLHKSGEPAQSDLHDTAYKLALERLANFHQQTMKERESKPHHALSGGLRRRFTIAGRFRGRASSDGDLEPRRKDRAPHRASLLAPRQAKPDEEREADQIHVLDAARENVRSRLDDIDRSVADRTGMVPPSTKSAWESRARSLAHAKAEAATEEARDVRRDVGGGLHVAQDDVHVIAKRNLKPLFREIDERAEKEREKKEREREEKEAKKAYEKEVEELHRKLKAEQKEKEKERQKALKEEERTRKREEKVGKWRRRSSAVIIPDMDIGSSDTARPCDAAAEQETSSESGARQDTGTRPTTSGDADDAGSREQGTSSPGKFKSWFKTKFTRQKPGSRSRADSETGRGFVGGHTLRSPGSGTSGTPPSSSTRNVGLVGRITHPHLEEARARTPSRGEGSEATLERQASSGTDEQFDDAKESLSPLKAVQRGANAKSRSPMRDSRFVEMMD